MGPRWVIGWEQGTQCIGAQNLVAAVRMVATRWQGDVWAKEMVAHALLS